MKINPIITYFCCLVVIAGLMTAVQVRAQTVDDTGLLENPVTNDTIVFASLVFNDVNSNGSYDATWVLSESEINVWDDYSTAIAFYTPRIEVRNGGSFTGSSTANNVQVIPGQLYLVWIDLDMSNKTYTTWVKSQAMADPVLIFQDAAFRKNSDSLSRWSALHNPLGEPDSVSVETVTLVGNAGDLPDRYTDASLSGLSLDVGTLDPPFDPDVTEYSAAMRYIKRTIAIVTPLKNKYCH